MSESFSQEEISRYRNAGALDLPKDQCPEGWYYCKELGCVSPELMSQIYPGLNYVARNDITGGRRRKRSKKRTSKKRASKKRTSKKRRGQRGGSRKRTRRTRKSRG